MKVRKVKIEQLAEDPNNVRVHDRRNIETIKGSLARFGQQAPLVVKGNVVRKGSGTLRAARELGWTELWVTETELEGYELGAFAIADNRTSDLSRFEDLPLARELKTLIEIPGFDPNVIGFDSDEVSGLLAKLAKDEEPDVELTGGGGNPEGGVIGAEPASGTADHASPADVANAQAAQVRIVQLFFDGEQFAEFTEKWTKLSKEYKTANVTDTVLEAIRRAHPQAAEAA